MIFFYNFSFFWWFDINVFANHISKTSCRHDNQRKILKVVYQTVEEHLVQTPLYFQQDIWQPFLL